MNGAIGYLESPEAGADGSVEETSCSFSLREESSQAVAPPTASSAVRATAARRRVG